MIRTKLYMMTQEELLVQIKKELKAQNIKYKEDAYGNIWSFEHEGRPAFVAHCDTVAKDDSVYKIPVVLRYGVLYRPKNILGADDRAGVNLILNHAKKINFIFTKDEEIGCLGAKELAENEEFIKDCEEKINFFIELDRRNGTDLLGNEHGYCSKELADDILKVLSKFKDTYGVLTDIDEFMDIRQGVNLSVGYYNAHTATEYLVEKEFNYIDSKIEELAQIEGHATTYDGYFNWSDIGSVYKKYAYAYDDIDYCEYCNAIISGDDIVDKHGLKLCKHCAEIVPDDEIKKYTSNFLKCSNCGHVIWDGDRYVEIKDWQVVFCEHCYNEKTMGASLYGNF